MTPEAAEVLQLAREWRAAASDDAPFGRQIPNRFLKLWIAWNALYALRCDDLEGDRNQLRSFAQWQSVVDAHVRGLDKQVYRRAVEAIAAFGVYNYQRSAPIHVPPPYASLDVLDAVYQVRCNLFHGKKSPTNLRDAQLVQASTNILVHLLDMLLATDEVWSQAAA
jgi:hypothetical protein